MQLRAVEQSLGRSLPDEYKDILRASNGVEGSIGSGAYLVLWPADEIASLNKAAAVDRFAPGLTLIGGDGGGEGYGFISREGVIEYVNVPLVGMSLKSISPMGASFDEFVDTLAHPGSAP
jgi:hypothetical protein